MMEVHTGEPMQHYEILNFHVARVDGFNPSMVRLHFPTVEILQR
ncbi:MAG: hypothetical protein ACLVL2_15815 [Bacteroides cellulosilyticus]